MDEEVLEEGRRDGWNIEIKHQPPNSPDLNALDLGFFSSIQALQHKSSPTSIDDLVKAVVKAYDNQSRNTLDNVFLSLQCAMESTMLADGFNEYKLQHMGKEHLRHEGKLPVSIRCDVEAYNMTKTTLSISTDYSNHTIN